MKSLMNIKNIAFYLSFPLHFISFVFPISAFQYGANSFQLGIIFGTLSLSSILVKPIIGFTLYFNNVLNGLRPIFLSYLKETVAINNVSLSYLYVPCAILSMVLPNKIGSFVDKSNKGTIIKISIILGIAIICYYTAHNVYFY